MAFATAPTTTIAGVEAGIRGSNYNIELSATTFEDGLIPGRFAKLDTGSVDKLDGSATPTILGVVMAPPTNATESLATIDSDIFSAVNFTRQGLVTVEVKTGETPAAYGRVYVSNAGDANDGTATATNTDEAVNAEFLYEVKTGVWMIYVNPAPGDLAAHIADALGAHAASAISILDTATVFTGVNVETVTNELYDKIQDHEDDAAGAHAASAISIADAGGYTATTEAEAAIQELYKYQMLPKSDPGDGNAIPVTSSGSFALTSAGAETRTLAIPTFEGQQVQINCDVYVGDIVITAASAINVGGNTIMTFGAADDTILLQAVQLAGVLAWRIVVNIGVALS